jgi:hypothetical protein
VIETMRRFASRDGRLAAATFVCAYFIVVAVGGRTTWERLRVPVEEPSFLDLRSLTSAWDCHREGVDVLAVNPCDPRERPANYPSLWLLPSPLGLGEDDTVPLGVAMAVAFFVLALAVTGPLTVREGAIYGVALCSPAVMFGVERGNPDLFIFAMLAGAILAFGRSGALDTLAYSLVLVATYLKLFPLFAWGVLVQRGRSVALAGGMAAALGVYVAATFGELRTILDVIPRDILFSYGAGVLADGIVQAGDLPGEHTAAVLSVGLVVAGVLVAAAVGSRWRRSSHAAREGAFGDQRSDAFWVGAGIYVGSYAVMHNYDYRLVFLLFALPQLLRWGGRRALSCANWVVLGILASLLLGARAVDKLAVEEILNWVLFVALTAALVAIAPSPRRGATREWPTRVGLR